MKRFVILILSATILFTMVGCNIGSENQDTPETESDACVEHSSELAAWSFQGECKICEAMEGKSFGTQCETWEDVVALAGFDKYSYEVNVTEYDNGISLDLTFDDAEQFTDDNWVCDFMCDSYLAFVGLSWFTWNKSSVEAPNKFQKFVVIMLEFPGGSIGCTTQACYSPIGISTSLFVDEESSNKFRIERIYNLFFKSVD